MTRNVCQCPNPPGGQVVCDSTQVAICRVKDGVLDSECLTPPSVDLAPGSEAWRLTMQNWLISAIRNVPREPLEPVTQGDLLMLAQGVIRDEVTGAFITFKLPDDLEQLAAATMSMGY